jgi:hypothetical protein
MIILKEFLGEHLQVAVCKNYSEHDSHHDGDHTSRQTLLMFENDAHL